MFGKFVREDVHMYERKKIAVVFVFTLCLISALAITFGSFLSKAKSKEPEVTYYKYYTNIEIQPGDTLWSLAENYMCENYEARDAYIKEVKEINSLNEDCEIISGQYLIMPYYSTEYKM